MNAEECVLRQISARMFHPVLKILEYAVEIKWITKLEMQTGKANVEWESVMLKQRTDWKNRIFSLLNKEREVIKGAVCVISIQSAKVCCSNNMSMSWLNIVEIINAHIDKLPISPWLLLLPWMRGCQDCHDQEVAMIMRINILWEWRKTGMILWACSEDI